MRAIYLLVPLCLVIMIGFAGIVAADDNWGPDIPPENVLTDPYGTIRSAWGDFADVMILTIFMTGIGLLYMKSQAVGPPLVVFIIGSMALGAIFPADTIIQKVMFIFAALGIVAMLYYSFAKRWGE